MLTRVCLLVAIAGALVQNHVVALPAAIAGPLAETRQDVARWQQQTTAGLVCRRALTEALSSPDDDPGRLEAAAARCQGAGG